MKQCVVMSGFPFFTREAKPLMEPTIDGAPSVQMPRQYFQDRHFVSRYEEKTNTLFWAALCNRKSSWISHLQISQMLQHNFYWWNLLDSSTWIEKSLLFSLSCKTSSASCDMSSVHLFIILFESGTFSISRSASYPSWYY
jgi:hypothetical protein